MASDRSVSGAFSRGMSSLKKNEDAGKAKRKDEDKKKRAAAAAAKKGSGNTAPKRGKQGVGGPGTIVKGSAPKAQTTKIRKAGTAKAPEAADKPVQTFGQSFKAARAKAKKAGDAGGGKFKWTNDKGVEGSFNTITSDDNKASAAMDVNTEKEIKALGLSQKDRPATSNGFFSKLGDKIKKATTLTGKPNKRKFQRGARMTPAERRKYDAAVKRYEAKEKPASGQKAGGRVGKPAKKAASRGSSAGMKAGGRVKTAARTSVKKKSPRRP